MQTRKAGVFISWSGAISRAVAEALRDWIEVVLPAVKPWMSEADIRPGNRWHDELSKQLETTNIGIICLTSDNVGSPWLLFEAGAIAKSAKSLVCTYLLGLEPKDLSGPLAQFQAASAERISTQKLVMSINDTLGERALATNEVERMFEKWWPELEEKLIALSQADGHPAGMLVPVQLHHVSLAVRDVAISTAFYQQTLGLKMIDRPKYDFGGTWFELPSGQHLHLVLNPNGTFRDQKPLAPRDCHFALRVPNFRKAVDSLLAAGFTTNGGERQMISDPHPTAGFPQLYIMDPDGHVIEINAERL